MLKNTIAEVFNQEKKKLKEEIQAQIQNDSN